MGDRMVVRTMRRAAVGCWEANVAVWDNLKRLLGGPDGGVLVGVVLLAAAAAMSCAFAARQMGT